MRIGQVCHLIIIVIFQLYFHSSTAKISAKEKPNIVLILADDLGFNDLSFRGSNLIGTPNIDALAYTGRVLNRHYVHSICTPSRSALLTGRHPIYLGTQGYPLKSGQRGGVPLNERLLPENLRELGYNTHILGKWHLGMDSHKRLPQNRGFHSFLGYYNGYIDYYMLDTNQTLPDGKGFYGFDLHNSTGPLWELKGQYATDLFTSAARRIIRDHSREGPLFLYLSHLAVHSGSDAPNQDGLQPPPGVHPDALFPHIKCPKRRKYASMVQSLDSSVAAVVEALAEKKILNNTVILLLSDNGGMPLGVDLPPNYASNWPLRGGKFTLYEGGVRGVGLIWSPLIPGGIVDEQFYHVTDWADILTSIAGGAPEKTETSFLLEKLLSNTSTPSARDLLINIDDLQNTEAAIIDSRWKIVKQNFGNLANLDLHSDDQQNSPDVPPVTSAHIMQSRVGQIVRELGMPLSEEIITNIRVSLKLPCSPRNPHRLGWVESSTEFFCKDYCLFDVMSDPCELRPLHKPEVLTRGISLLDQYRTQIRPQPSSSVDISSDPSNFGGVWTPWLKI